MSIIALIPALDEEATIAGVTSAVRAHVDRVVVIDNGSRDETAKRAAAAGAEVAREGKRGYGAACLAGLAYVADAADADVVIFIDADGQSDPGDIPALIAPILAGDADLVIGSRVLGAEAGALSAVQRFGNWLASRLLGVLYGAAATDLGPTRAITMGALRRLEMRDKGFGWTVEMQARAAIAGLVVREVAVSYRPRAAGASKISGTLRGTARAGHAILWTLWRTRRSGQRPDERR